MSTDSVVRENIELMNRLEGFSVVVVCCSNSFQANYWQQRLENGRGSILSPQAIVLAVHEDWPGGAGNALGTLYAFQNAVKLAKERNGIDLEAELASGSISVGLYHTAGKGTRLAPLPGSENNNKPGVKLPATILIGDKMVPITILEAVIKQTGCYASSRLGRLSVFWGDQVFIPTVPVSYSVTHHIDILCSLGPMMTELEWKEKGMDKYGLIAQNSSGGAAQVEKVDHSTAVSLLSHLGEISQVGASLGSFSVSSPMLQTLLEEFSEELKKKEGKLDSDPHLWMPMTLDKEAYIQLMTQKKVSSSISELHHERIKRMMEKFNSQEGNRSLGLFGPVDVGQGVHWWDYGQLKLYQKNTLLLLGDSEESRLMRLFYQIGDQRIRDSVIFSPPSSSSTSSSSSSSSSDLEEQQQKRIRLEGEGEREGGEEKGEGEKGEVKGEGGGGEGGVVVDEKSCISSSRLGEEGGVGSSSGFIRNSILSNVRCKSIEAEGCILINVTAEHIRAPPGSILYNIVDHTNTGLTLQEGEVRVGVFQEDGSQIIIHSSTEICGGKSWEEYLPSNPNHSFEDIYQLNSDVCPYKLEKIIEDRHDTHWESININPTTPIVVSSSSSSSVSSSSLSSVSSVSSSVTVSESI